MSEVLFKYFDPEAIKLAFYRVQCWSDKTVKDQVGLKAFGANLDTNAKRLHEKIMDGIYTPQRGFKFYMPKSTRTLRTKTMLEVEDALVYQAIANKIAELHQPKLSELEEFVFGSVLAPDVTKGVALIKDKEPNYFFFKFWKGLFRKFKESVLHSIEIDKTRYKFETDITGFFDSIPHYNLLLVLSEEFGVEDEILDLLSDCFNVWSGTKESMTPGVGIPQGPIPSFFFANLILHELDGQIVGQGYKYYRYMDDIHIYGFEENELVEALLIIDKYTKGNGLSINSKKTSIQEIEDGKEEETIKKEIKKLSLSALYSEDPDEIINTDLFDDNKKEEINDNSKLLDKEVNKLSEQDQGPRIDSFWKNVTTLKDEKEIKEFWEEQFREVEKKLPELFINSGNSKNLQLNERVEDIDFIKLSVQYSSSKKALLDIGIEKEVDTALIKYWLFAYQKFFWRVNNLGIILGAYGANQEVKTALMKMYEVQFKPYEWVRYYIIMILSFNQEFSDKELRQVFFRWLKEENSDLVKISLYRLLFKHSKSKQFSSSLKKELQKEPSVQLKLIIADFNRSNRQQEIDMVEFINTIGL
ncbi:RNA-directed DNA polymerase [Algoriphagus halophilus]|uniref:Reverse transcriptase (RNA-dependent DNA polymerase) n=1 Tax=Algoriphagus halophilus TaxID=226505 RepID=A0A1N6D5X6_9BACT|nr:RNA-directed DNA polymerase [Algoriphagus halophilus]SIN66240.1 Reverse transcriptase (RNA-dependent DNA polymerase) [Algoriphagus halophilus]